MIAAADYATLAFAAVIAAANQAPRLHARLARPGRPWISRRDWTIR